MAAAEEEEGASAAAGPASGVDGGGDSPAAEGEGAGAAGEEGKDAAAEGAEAVADSEEDGEDVFEVEKILDMKTEGGKVLYKVRWKGYTSDDDTWEPEVHLEDCKEVLLEFRKKVADNKAKPVKKDIQRLSLNSDIFEANSDSDPQSETREDTSPKKRKKNLRHKEEKSPDDLKKKKAKTGKLKPKPDLESTSESLVFDLRTKKRILEAKEELKESKKPKKDDVKETKELKKVKRGEIRDLKTKIREDSKENRKTKREKCVESQVDSELSVLSDSPFQEEDSEDLHSDSREEKLKIQGAKDKAEPEAIQDGVPDKQPEGPVSADEEEVRAASRRKKKLKRTEELKESKKLENKNLFLEKKNIQKKQRNQDRGRSSTELDKPMLASTPAQRTSRPSAEERGSRPTDSPGEEKEAKKNEPKEKYQKRHDLDKEEKGRKEPRALKTFKEIRNAFDLFKLTPEEKNDFPDNNWKREEIPADCKVTEDHKPKENKQLLKERRNTRDETDTWAYIAADGDQELVDSTCHSEETCDGRQQILSLGMDLQLEWMKLEDFQKHLDGEDENFTTADAVPNSLRDAVKNGDYITVKVALNSSEDYNLDQEDSSGMTLVMLAAAGGQDDLLRLLLRKGAKVNGRQKNGTTALIHAAEKNFLTTVAILLEAGAFVNVQQSNGETALMKACKRGNSDIVRLVIECGADCNILSKHQNSALHFAKQCNNVLVYELLKSHLETLSRVAEETIKDYFEARLTLLEPVFPIACHRLCEGPDFSMDFNYRPPQNIPEGSGVLLFIFHANFLGKEVIARLCGPCSVQAVVLNDKFQLPVFLDSHFVYSFSPAAGLNKLFIRLTEAPSAKNVTSSISILRYLGPGPLRYQDPRMLESFIGKGAYLHFTPAYPPRVHQIISGLTYNT
ncbi:M-phase phosphoprotein 8 isoform X2 [Hippopotamus amphibius kiboko]|uniref:M-phase phosphoprotein 8 isoform X2 n=1 Tax=Hippopotamus amphibius kiboko TaxID=575201 RepID=UPI0025989235|nr:M-phase phosphoprotein 8 isoform X2 [Hippopotamus amphibius kiboko]